MSDKGGPVVQSGLHVAVNGGVSGSSPDRSIEKRLADLGVTVLEWVDATMCIAKADIKVFRDQDLNARVMTQEMFHQLTENVRDRGVLESTPLCCLSDKGIEIISGHHRVRGARAARIKTPIYFLLETQRLSLAEIRSKQLAHNSIQGSDDMTILKEMYAQIDNAKLRLESFIDEKALGLAELPSVKIETLDTGLEAKIVTLAFLPHQLKNWEALLERINPESEAFYTAPIEDWEAFKEAVQKTQKTEHIRSVGTTVARMTEITLQHLQIKLDDNTNGDE